MGGAEGAVIQLPIVNGGGAEGRGRCYSVTNCKWGAEGRGRCYSVTNCKWEGLRALLFSNQL